MASNGRPDNQIKGALSPFRKPGTGWERQTKPIKPMATPKIPSLPKRDDGLIVRPIIVR